jgi:hypothetical protein
MPASRLLALPPKADNPKSRLLREYLFTTKGALLLWKELLELAKKSPGWDASFPIGIVDESTESLNSNEDEAMTVRKGITHLRALGPVPSFPEGDVRDERASSSQVEEELSRKFSAIIDDLSFGDASDCESWYKAGQCMFLKADLVADRLGMSKGFTRSMDFVIPDRSNVSEASLSLADLVKAQKQDSVIKDDCWTCHIGNDLSIYQRRIWSSFSSLQALEEEIGVIFVGQEESEADPAFSFRRRVYEELTSLFRAKDFPRWQQTWGGLFVSSLRTIALRCTSLALYMSHKCKASDESLEFVADILEGIGVFLYSELSGSQVYGCVTDHRSCELSSFIHQLIFSLYFTQISVGSHDRAEETRVCRGSL